MRAIREHHAPERRDGERDSVFTNVFERHLRLVHDPFLPSEISGVPEGSEGAGPLRKVLLGLPLASVLKDARAGLSEIIGWP